MNSRDLVDLIYVSELKLAGLSRALSGRKPGVTLGLEASLPLLFNLKLERSSESHGSVAVELQATIRRLRLSYGIHRTEDPYLHAGHWFEGETDMVYGQGKWDFSPHDEGPVLFVGTAVSVEVLLGGSPQHLLDREVLLASGRTGSTSEKLREELQRVLQVQEGAERTSRSVSLFAEDLQDSVFDTFDCVGAELAKRAARVHVAYIALVHEVFDDRATGRRIVLGTPLVVARLQPVLASGFEPRQPPQQEPPTRRRWWFGKTLTRPLPEPALPPAIALAPDSDRTIGAPLGSLGPLDPTAPSLDVELYVGPASAAIHSSPQDYYRDNPEMQAGELSEAVGQHAFLTEQVHWLDEQGGRWIVAFCRLRDDAGPIVTASSVGDVVATAVTQHGAGKVLVLKQRVTLWEVVANLREYRQVEPMLRWVTTRLQY